MTGKGQVFDSNILIYHINGQLDIDMERILLNCFNYPAYISTITAMEVLSWPGHTDETILSTTAFLTIFDEVSITSAIKNFAIEIRRNYRLKLPDAIIAATALDLGVPLITRNMKDFKDIQQLTLINPFGNLTIQHNLVA